MKQVYLVKGEERLGPYKTAGQRGIMVKEKLISREDIQALGFTIEEVKEKRREVWINLYEQSGAQWLNDAHHETKTKADFHASGRAKEAINFVQINPGERVVSREDINEAWCRVFAVVGVAHGDFLKALGMEDETK